MQNIRFLFQGITIDDRTREYIEKRIRPVEKVTNENISQIEVEINVDKKGLFRVEIMVNTPKNLYRAEEISESVEGSTDLATDQIRNQIVRKQEKVWTKIMRGARSIKKKLTIYGDARFK